MTSLREQITQRKAAKKYAANMKAEKSKLESAKRKRDHDNKIDFIPQLEWYSSSYYAYFNLMKDKLRSNKLVIDDLLQHFVQLHRFTFWNCDYDFSNIRLIIESLFDKFVSGFDLSNVEQVINNSITIHYKQRDLLMQFMDLLPSLFFTIKSRKLFAAANSEMIVEHNAWVNLTKPSLTKFIDWEGVEKAQEVLRLKINSKNIYKAVRDKKILIYTETGDIEEL